MGAGRPRKTDEQKARDKIARLEKQIEELRKVLEGVVKEEVKEGV